MRLSLAVLNRLAHHDSIRRLCTRYSLVGFISHVGKNTGCGHYVAHIRKEGRWAIFDDRKVM